MWQNLVTIFFDALLTAALSAYALNHNWFAGQVAAWLCSICLFGALSCCYLLWRGGDQRDRMVQRSLLEVYPVWGSVMISVVDAGIAWHAELCLAAAVLLGNELLQWKLRRLQNADAGRDGAA